MESKEVYASAVKRNKKSKWNKEVEEQIKENQFHETPEAKRAKTVEGHTAADRQAS